MSARDFNWYADDSPVVLRAYGSIAVHENELGDVVIRQERDALEDEDHWVAIPVQDAEYVARAIIAKAAEIKAAPPPARPPKETGTRAAPGAASSERQDANCPTTEKWDRDSGQGRGGMMAAFADAAPAWADAGIVPLPVYPDGKKTMVKRPEAFGRPAAMGLAAKPRYAAANLGFMCGAFNRLTVVDIDSPADSELQHALETYGDSPIIVSTPSGGRHVYYAHNDEPRRVRLDARHPIDMLGGGLCVAPPSVRPSGASYAWLRGGLADIANGNLPKIRNGAVQKTRDTGQIPAGPRVQKGERNAQLFRYCRQIVGYCDDLDQLTDAARTWSDSRCAEPLPEAEIVRTASSVFKFQGGRKQVMQHIVESPLYQKLIADVEVWALFSYLATENGPNSQFMVADGLGPARGWPRRFVPEGRKALLGMGAIKCVRFPRKGVPALYRWNLGSPVPAYERGRGDKGLHTDSGRPFGGLS